MPNCIFISSNKYSYRLSSNNALKNLTVIALDMIWCDHNHNGLLSPLYSCCFHLFLACLPSTFVFLSWVQVLRRCCGLMIAMTMPYSRDFVWEHPLIFQLFQPFQPQFCETKNFSNHNNIVSKYTSFWNSLIALCLKIRINVTVEHTKLSLFSFIYSLVFIS